ncbi:MAG: (Fe-S)-binding protein [Flavobacteriaceae bacterium]|nr:(Fe-S)-binding protein [Flavobacteriaceae bacterium]
MEYLPNILFLLLLIAGVGLFTRNIRRVIRNVKLGKSVENLGDKSERWKQMLLVAIGQSKMVTKPISGFLHVIVYVGFIIINVELLEIIADGIFGTHRLFSSFLGGFYQVLIATFELLAFLVVLSVVLFWIRRNILKINRFLKPEMKSWPKNDANYILYFEVVLMGLFLTMNAADFKLQQLGVEPYAFAGGIVGSFSISTYIAGFFDTLSASTLIIIERTAWWLHIIGILTFLNYLYWSKHLHIMLAFPNVWFASVAPKGKFDNMASVTKEVKLMMDPNADPFAAPPAAEGDEVPATFGASDIFDLNQIQLLNAYTCTECGRCTQQCPANITGKKLSPRKIMMDTRDRLEEVGKIINTRGQFEDDGKKLLDDYISREELWACTTCNACVEACPVGINPLSIIMDMRRYLIMEQSAAPNELNVAMTNIENNAAPWPYNQMDRLNWANEN